MRRRTSIWPTASTKLMICPLPRLRPARRRSRPNVSRFARMRVAETSSGCGTLMSCCTTRPLDQGRRRIAADAIDILLILQNHTQRILDGVSRELSRAECQQRARPIQRFGHSRRFEEIDFAQSLREAADLQAQLLRSLRHLRAEDAELLIETRKIDPIIETAPFQRVVDFARAVRG